MSTVEVTAPRHRGIGIGMAAGAVLAAAPIPMVSTPAAQADPITDLIDREQSDLVNVITYDEGYVHTVVNVHQFLLTDAAIDLSGGQVGAALADVVDAVETDIQNVIGFTETDLSTDMAFTPAYDLALLIP